MELSEQTKIEAQIGFTLGILIGAVAAGVLVIIFTDWQWYFKLFSAIGTIGIIGNLYLALRELFRSRKSLIEAMAEMKKMKEGKNEKEIE